jgi:hypothetical protein
VSNESRDLGCKRGPFVLTDDLKGAHV